MSIEFAGEFRRHDSSAIVRNFSMVEAHPKILAAHATFKTRIRIHR
jgi:hypothetical protein